MKPLSLSVREFALPVPRTGSIESNSGYGLVADGTEIHVQIQAQRVKADPTYRSEVKISRVLEHGGYRFQIGGRVDGIFGSDPARIEEIKSCFNPKELKEKLSSGSHPYRLQLQTYGYFHWLETGEIPRLFFHLVSTRNFASHDLEISLDTKEYEPWLARRLEELASEARLGEERAHRREKLGESLAFPFEQPRSGQLELVEAIEEGMVGRERMLIQAPTGLGKTVGVLYPVMREALGRGQKVIYVAPKNSQFSVAEDAVERFRDCGTKARSLTVTAKSKICFKAEPLCNPEYCEYARDYYQKVDENRLTDLLARKKKLTSRVFRKVGEDFQVCPFELQFEAARDADVIICDYNYAFAPRVASGRLEGGGIGESGKPNLVVDEVHNLYSRALGYYSAELSTEALGKMREPIQNLPSPFSRLTERLLDDCLSVVMACAPEGAKAPVEIQPPTEVFLAQEGELRALLSRYLESDVEIAPRDPVLRLCFYWSEFTEALAYVGSPRRPEFFTLFRPLPPAGGAVKISCADASEKLRDRYDSYEQVVGFSATLKPFDYYAKLSGLDPKAIRVAEFQSPFPPENRKLLIIREISTKYSDRERNYAKIAEAISRIAAVRSGNYLAFFPSFDFMERVLAIFTPPLGFLTLRQHRYMTAGDIEKTLDHLRDRIAPTIVFGVQGGVFSEGVDYPGEMVIGAFVVGPPLPTFDLEREEMSRYYQKQYGAGFAYAYSYPAMAKAVQAAGRVVRSGLDRGLIVLMDGRFLTPGYSRSMPRDWFEESPGELVSRSILRDVEEFWQRTE